MVHVAVLDSWTGESSDRREKFTLQRCFATAIDFRHGLD